MIPKERDNSLFVIHFSPTLNWRFSKIARADTARVGYAYIDPLVPHKQLIDLIDNDPVSIYPSVQMHLPARDDRIAFHQ